MTENEVFEIIGKPLTKDSIKDNIIRFQYSKSKKSTHYRLRQIYFENGRVKEVIGYYYID